MQNRAIRWQIVQKPKYFFISYQINSGNNPLQNRKKISQHEYAG